MHCAHVFRDGECQQLNLNGKMKREIPSQDLRHPESSATPSHVTLSMFLKRRAELAIYRSCILRYNSINQYLSLQALEGSCV